MNKYLNPKKYLNYTNRKAKEICIFYPWFLILPKKPWLIKFFIPWYKLLNKNSLKNKLPWLSFEAVEWIDSYLRKDMTIFEWGSGGSTIYFSKKVKKIISVEHDSGWYEMVSKAIEKNDVLNCEYILKKPTISKDKKSEVSAPGSYLSSDKAYLGFDFENYCKAIELFPDKFFDLVLVDGRARPSCMLHALNKVRDGGYLMLDNSERNKYLPAINILLKDWIRKDFFGPLLFSSQFGQTSIFTHPK